MTTSDYFVLTALDDQSDEDVLRAWRNGRTQGLDVLFQRYGIKVYSLAYEMLADAEEAAAMTQEVFAALRQPCAEKPDAWQTDAWSVGQDTLYSFLITLTRSRCLAQVEGRGWQYAIVKRLQGLFSWRKSQTSLTDAQSMMTVDHLKHSDEAGGANHLLSTLSRKEHDILRVAYYEASDPKTLAKRLHIPPKIAQHRSRKALIKLHDTRLKMV